MTAAAPEIQLSAAQLASFEENGFLAIESLLDDSDLSAVEQEYAVLLNQLATELRTCGRIPALYDDQPFGQRFSSVLEHYPELHRHFNISLPLINGPVDDPETYRTHTGPAVFELIRNPKILDVVACIIGPEIFSSPVQQMRMKPPEKELCGDNAVHSNVGASTWHQDIVALLPEADQTRQLTVWVPAGTMQRSADHVWYIEVLVVMGGTR